MHGGDEVLGGLTRRAFLGTAAVGVGMGMAHGPLAGAAELGGGAAPGSAGAAAGAGAAVGEWRRTRLLRACLAGPVKQEIEDMTKAGANVIQCNLNAWVTEQRDGTGILGGDPVGDFVEYTHSLGAKATGYLNTRLAPQLKDHPDWISRTYDGKSLSGDENPSACQNSPYGKFLINQMAAYTKRFPIDGWWLDCWTFTLQTCWCPFCTEQFTKATGSAMPAKPDLKDAAFRKYLAWRDAAAERFFREMREAVNAARADVHIWVNFAMGPFEGPLPFSDDVFRQVESPTVEVWLAGQMDNALATPFGIARMKGAAGDREAEIWMVPTALQWERTTTPDVEMMARIYTILTYGAVVQFPAAPGRNEQMKTAFDAITAREPWIIGAEPMRWAALVLSNRTADFYGRNEAIRKYYQEVMGVFRAMSEEHLPVQIVTERDVEEGRLADYKIAVVANAACLSVRAQEALRAFVDGGGGLVATHETSLYDEAGEQQAEFGLAPLLGAKYAGAEESKGWASDRLWFENHATADDEIIRYSQWQCTVSTPKEWLGSVDWAGRALNVEAAEGSEVAARRNGTGRTMPTWPALVTRAQGKGRVAYFPLELGASYYHTSFPYLRRWLYKALLWAANEEPPVSVKGPLNLIATYWRQPAEKRVVVHLLNDLSSAGRRPRDAMYAAIREEVAPMNGIRVGIRGSGWRGASFQPNTQRLVSTQTSGGAVVTVPPLGQHALVVFET